MEIAIKEFPSNSTAVIAEMCGVSHMTVQRTMPEQLEQSSTSTDTGTDGKQYPATRNQSKPTTPEREEAEIITRGSADAATGGEGHK